MAAETQDLRKYLENANNLYEAVIVIAQRGRDINAEYISKKREQEIMDETDLLLDDEEQIHNVEMTKPDKNEIKPLIVAQEEFLEGKLEYYYEQKKSKRP